MSNHRPPTEEELLIMVLLTLRFLWLLGYISDHIDSPRHGLDDKGILACLMFSDVFSSISDIY